MPTSKKAKLKSRVLKIIENYRVELADSELHKTVALDDVALAPRLQRLTDPRRQGGLRRSDHAAQVTLVYSELGIEEPWIVVE